MSAWTLCIDFGTAFSKAAAAPADAWGRFQPGEVRPLMLAGGRNPFLLESAVFVEGDTVLLGPAAMARADALAHEKRAALRSFKTLLSASDLDIALKTAPPRSIDPGGKFVLRDLVVLYLAYLLASIGRAIDADPVLAGADAISFRYAAPAWRGGDSAGMHGQVVRLFGEAEAMRAALGPALLAPEGVPGEMVRAAAAAARAAPAPLPIGLIFEATAAAAYTAIGLEGAAPHLIVLDMGAGTTDVAALSQIGEGGRMIELSAARVTLKQAGDFVDGVIANIFLARSGERTAQAQGALWRTLMRDMRDLKETLFAEGEVMFRHNGRALRVKLGDVEKDRDFVVFAKALEEAYRHGLDALCAEARAAGAAEIQAVAVGGGAAAPFIQAMMRLKPKRAGKVRVRARPATPDWAHAPAFDGNLAPVFPQLAIAIGGALAPEPMLAARALIPAATARSDTQPARD